MEDKLAQGVNMVVITPTIEIRNALIRVIAETSGICPTHSSESESARRAHYAPAKSQLIINTASAEMQTKLGFHVAALPIIVSDTLIAAKKAKGIFEQAGLRAEIIRQAEPEFPEDFIIFVRVYELMGILVMFWPRPEDITPEILAKLPKREPWIE